MGYHLGAPLTSRVFLSRFIPLLRVNWWKQLLALVFRNHGCSKPSSFPLRPVDGK